MKKVNWGGVSSRYTDVGGRWYVCSFNNGYRIRTSEVLMRDDLLWGC